MAVTASTRLGITRWSAGTDPVTRAQFDGSHSLLDDLTAIDLQGTDAARPAAGVRGRFYFGTTTSRLWRDTGAAWVEVLTPASVPSLFGSPGASRPGDTASDGVATTLARADHRHARDVIESLLLGHQAFAGPGGGQTFSGGTFQDLSGVAINVTKRLAGTMLTVEYGFEGEARDGTGVTKFNVPTNALRERVVVGATNGSSLDHRMVTVYSAERINGRAKFTGIAAGAHTVKLQLSNAPMSFAEWHWWNQYRAYLVVREEAVV